MASTDSTGHIPRSIFMEEVSSSGHRQFHSSGTAGHFEDGSSQQMAAGSVLDSSGTLSLSGDVNVSASGTIQNQNIQNVATSTAATIQRTGTVLVDNTTNQLLTMAIPVRGAAVTVIVQGVSDSVTRIISGTSGSYFGNSSDNQMITGDSDVSAPLLLGRRYEFFSTGVLRWRIKNILPTTGADITLSTARTS